MISTLVQSATILLREGLEAMLVIAALAAYIDKLGMRRRLGALYAGAGAAIVASFFAAWLFEVFNNGVHSDILEGITILGAAALMLYVSGWLLLRQDARAWQQFLKTKADGALSRQTGDGAVHPCARSVIRRLERGTRRRARRCDNCSCWLVFRDQHRRAPVAIAARFPCDIRFPLRDGAQIYWRRNTGISGTADRPVYPLRGADWLPTVGL
jgi:Iron permease FTR1 family